MGHPSIPSPIITNAIGLLLQWPIKYRFVFVRIPGRLCDDDDIPRMMLVAVVTGD